MSHTTAFSCTGCDHEHTDAVTEASLWLAVQGDPPRPIVPALRERFGLTAKQACEAISAADDFRRRAGRS